MEFGRTKAARAVARVFWASVVLAHGVGAVVAVVLLPGGFPLTHARFLADRVLPALVVASVIVVIVRARRRSPSVPTLLLLYPSAWFGIALSAAIAFPESGGRVALAAGMFALVFALGLLGEWRRGGLSRGVGVVALAAALGAAFVLAQRAPERLVAASP